MGYRILALTENTIGAQLLLSVPLKALGHRVTVLLTPGGFKERMEVEAYDCLILDDTAIGTQWRQVLEEVSRLQGRVGVVWLGQPPRGLRTPLSAVFAKPLRYGEITEFFTRWVPPSEGSAEKGAGESGEGTAREGRTAAPPYDARRAPVVRDYKRGKRLGARKRT